MAQKVSEIIKDAKLSASPARVNHVRKVIAKIADLESRGLLKRQQFQSPTTADFERHYAYKKRLADKLLS